MNDNLEVEVFRAGDYGEKGRWDAALLDQIAADYDPALHEAPVTLDHARRGPALGWVEAIRRVGDRLVARLRGLNLKLLELLRQGAFKKRSVEIYPALRETGRPYLRAVSFLGAAVPEVKGLADPVLPGAGGGVGGALFGEDDPNAPALSFEEALGGVGQEVMAEAQSGRPAEAGSQFNQGVACPPPAEAGGKDEPAGSRLSNPERASAEGGTGTGGGIGTDERAATPEPGGTAATQAPSQPEPLAFDELATRLRAGGSWRPAWAARGIAEFYGALASLGEIEYGEGERMRPADWFAAFLESLPPAVSFEEAAPAAPLDFAGPLTDAASFDPASLTLHRAAAAMQQATPGLSYAEALLRASARKA